MRRPPPGRRGRSGGSRPGMVPAQPKPAKTPVAGPAGRRHRWPARPYDDPEGRPGRRAGDNPGWPARADCICSIYEFVAILPILWFSIVVYDKILNNKKYTDI